MKEIDLDNEPLRFGKYKGKTPNEVATQDHSYIRWLYDTVEPKVCSKGLALACEEFDEDEDEDQKVDYE